MYYAIKFEDGRYLKFGSVLNRYDHITAETYYTVYSGDGASECERAVRKRSAEQIANCFVKDPSDARIFDNMKSAQNAGRNGPYKFEVVEVEVLVREK